MPTALVVPADIHENFYYMEVESLEDYQKVVGGYIEGIPIREHPDTTVFINEEGKLQGLPLNKRATEILRQSIFSRDAIVGDVLILSINEDGESVDISSEAGTYCVHCCIRAKAIVA